MKIGCKMNKHKEFMTLLSELGDAGADAQTKFCEYLEAVSRVRAISDQIANYTKDYLSKPHIDLEDFEIDG